MAGVVSLQHCHTCWADPSVPTNTHTRGHTTHTHLVTLTSTSHFPLMINPWLYSHEHSYKASPVALDNCDPDSEHTCSTLAHHCYLWHLSLSPVNFDLCIYLTSAGHQPNIADVHNVADCNGFSSIRLLCHSHIVTAIYVFQFNFINTLSVTISRVFTETQTLTDKQPTLTTLYYCFNPTLTGQLKCM